MGSIACRVTMILAPGHLVYKPSYASLGKIKFLRILIMRTAAQTAEYVYISGYENSLYNRFTLQIKRSVNLYRTPHVCRGAPS